MNAEDLRIGLRFLGALPRFLRTPFTMAEARAAVQARRDRRRDLFAARLRDAWSMADGPYRTLCEHAGCTLDDLHRLTAREGIEGTLTTLFRAGVYLAGDEFKGRRPVVRGSLRFTVDPSRLLNPRSLVHGLSESSGSRGIPTPVPIDLAFVRDHAVNTHVTLDAHGGRDWVHAHYGVPGGTAVTNLLEFAKGGRPAARWFTPIHVATPGLNSRYRLGAAAMRLGGRLAGVSIPPPAHAPLDDPEPVVRWIASERCRGRVPHVWTFASSAVLVCQAAAAAGLDISGTRFTAGGEPTTAARRAAIEAAGAVVLPRMGATETDILSYACASPMAADDMHWLDDRHVLIQPGEDSAPAGVPARALLLTSLLPSAPICLLNVSLGDQARCAIRACGCPLERQGWSLHVHDVRSFEKLTAGGITFLDADVIRVLEETLPARFGGSPTDYQVVERLDSGTARRQVRLLVHPALGPLDPEAVADVFLRAIGEGSGGTRLMELQWRQAGVLQVVREPPHRTSSGKILHMHQEAG